MKSARQKILEIALACCVDSISESCVRLVVLDPVQMLDIPKCEFVTNLYDLLSFSLGVPMVSILYSYSDNDYISMQHALRQKTTMPNHLLLSLSSAERHEVENAEPSSLLFEWLVLLEYFGVVRQHLRNFEIDLYLCNLL